MEKVKSLSYVIINERFESLNKLFDYYHISKTNRYKLHINSYILINGVCSKDISNEYQKISVNKGDTIEIDQTMFYVSYPKYDLDIKILYEDDDIVIVYKMPNILVHPDGARNDTLLNALSYYYRDTLQYICHLHRLDYETSGMIVFAKNIFSYCFLSHEWENKNVLKKYICLVSGIVKDIDGVIDNKIGKDRHSANQFVKMEKGDAITSYKVISRDYKHNQTKLEVTIQGGKKHQIRAHLASIGHPIVNDLLYNKKENKNGRLYLEFVHIEFTHPKTFKNFVFDIGEEF